MRCGGWLTCFYQILCSVFLPRTAKTTSILFEILNSSQIFDSKRKKTIRTALLTSRIFVISNILNNTVNMRHKTLSKHSFIRIHDEDVKQKTFDYHYFKNSFICTISRICNEVIIKYSINHLIRC